jgi:excisionase family DNA binding protein
MDDISFNDLPKVMSQVLDKVEGLEKAVNGLKNELGSKGNQVDGHIPMTIDEACEFLRMKKSTMYYNLEHGNIPGTRRGKNYILFKDELIHWLEGGRTNSDAMMNAEELNASIMNSQKRKPKIVKL